MATWRQLLEAARAALDEPGDAVLVVPEGDDADLTHMLATSLRNPATVQTVPLDWPAMGD